ncbi:MAG: hypothetical protein ABIQ95_06525 [Bdellovibrionia bacterium]
MATQLVYPELPNWVFIIDEVSAGFYKVIGRSKFGHLVELNGIDPDALLVSAKEYAASISS